jgi:dihydropteroate synthase
MAVRSVLAGVPVGDGFPVRLMAVINVSPESFYAGSVRGDDVALRETVRQVEAEGADFIDIGAMSTAPYLDTHISVEEETRRIKWALDVVLSVATVPISADTCRAAVAAAALASGARIVNDVTGLRGDPTMAGVAAQAEGVVLMASQDEESTHETPLPLVRRLLTESVQRAERAGIPAELIVLDPGIGFFTRAGVRPEEFACQVLNELETLCDLGKPLLVGVSRKSFVGKITGRFEPGDRLWGSLGAAAVAVYKGAAIIRTHDVAPTRDAVRVAEAIRVGKAVSR